MRWEIQDHGSNVVVVVVVVVVEGHEVIDDGKRVVVDACITTPVAKAGVVQDHSVTWHM